MKKILFSGIVLSLLILSGCQKQADNWVGFYYPIGAPDVGEATCETREFETKNECEGWAEGMIGTTEGAEYYCGYKCKYDSSCQYACGDTLDENIK